MIAQSEDNDDEIISQLPGEVEEALRRQDEALMLLERLRAEEPWKLPHADGSGGGRRDFRRWPTPEGVTLELHDGLHWQTTDCLDMGVGGARIANIPRWIQGPVPARLRAPEINAVLVLADVMWKESGKEGKAGLRFEFQDAEEQEQWSGALIDALLARHALR